MMPKIGGYLLQGCGILHTVVGILIGWPQIKAIVNAGIWNALGQLPDAQCMLNIPCMQQTAIWWFIAFGLLLIIIGKLCSFIENTLKEVVPRSIIWSILSLSTLGAILLPASGFWLVMVTCLYIHLTTQKSAEPVNN